MADLIELRRREYDERQTTLALRREVFEHGNRELMQGLFDAEVRLAEVSDARAAAEKTAGVAIGGPVASPGLELLGAETTKLDAQIDLRLAQIPTSLVHLFTQETLPLVACRVKNHDEKTRRLRFTTFVEGYSAQAIDTREIPKGQEAEVQQLPTFFTDRLRTVTELTRATVNVEIRDLDAKTEQQKTLPVWLLARTTAPLQVLDPANGALRDMTPYLGAFVTPNHPDVIRFTRPAAEVHPKKRLMGYQISQAEVEPQVEAVYAALKRHELRYVNSVIHFTPETGSQNQRIRLPRETLADQAGNCIDLTLLFCSLLEAISMNPAIVIIPGHAFVGWETWRDSGSWRYLDATLIPRAEFRDAVATGEATAKSWSAMSKTAAQPRIFRRLSMRELRAQGITPLE